MQSQKHNLVVATNSKTSNSPVQGAKMITVDAVLIDGDYNIVVISKFTDNKLVVFGNHTEYNTTQSIRSIPAHVKALTFLPINGTMMHVLAHNSSALQHFNRTTLQLHSKDQFKSRALDHAQFRAFFHSLQSHANGMNHTLPFNQSSSFRVLDNLTAEERSSLTTFLTPPHITNSSAVSSLGKRDFSSEAVSFNVMRLEASGPLNQNITKTAGSYGGWEEYLRIAVSGVKNMMVDHPSESLENSTTAAFTPNYREWRSGKPNGDALGKQLGKRCGVCSLKGGSDDTNTLSKRCGVCSGTSDSDDTSAFKKRCGICSIKGDSDDTSALNKRCGICSTTNDETSKLIKIRSPPTMHTNPLRPTINKSFSTNNSKKLFQSPNRGLERRSKYQSDDQATLSIIEVIATEDIAIKEIKEIDIQDIKDITTSEPLTTNTLTTQNTYLLIPSLDSDLPNCILAPPHPSDALFPSSFNPNNNNNTNPNANPHPIRFLPNSSEFNIDHFITITTIIVVLLFLLKGGSYACGRGRRERWVGGNLF